MAQALTPRRRLIGGLSTIEWSAPQDAPAVIFFHGYGADGADLAALAPELQLEAPVRWLFPDAPLTLDWGGRAWFEIDTAAIERAQRSGKSVDWSQGEPAGAADARAAVAAFLSELAIPWKRLVLGGFSQGGMLAADLVLRAPENPLGLIVLSGNVVNEASWREMARTRAGMRFFQSHGIADPILGFQGARRLEDVLRQGGLQGKLLSFEGGHTVPPEVIEGLRNYLRSIVSSP